jgi:hypothetical protein
MWDSHSCIKSTQQISLEQNLIKIGWLDSEVKHAYGCDVKMSHRPDDGGSKHLCNVGHFLPQPKLPYMSVAVRAWKVTAWRFCMQKRAAYGGSGRKVPVVHAEERSPSHGPRGCASVPGWGVDRWPQVLDIRTSRVSDLSLSVQVAAVWLRQRDKSSGTELSACNIITVIKWGMVVGETRSTYGRNEIWVHPGRKSTWSASYLEHRTRNDGMILKCILWNWDVKWIQLADSIVQ